MLDPMKAIQVMDAAMGDDWAEVGDDDAVEAARVLLDNGMLASLPGRYGRTAMALLAEHDAGQAEFNEYR